MSLINFLGGSVVAKKPYVIATNTEINTSSLQTSIYLVHD